MIRYGSICSGIEAATVAWHPFGWEPQFFAEIAAFPCAVLKHHYPDVRNYGDFTSIDRSAGPIDVLVGGTPCQSFSVAGKRAGLDDPRGNLTLEFLALAGRIKPRWIVWENVPGVLSDDGGRTFGTVLGILGQLGYGFAYRILDAQYFGVPQRRRRVFVVGCLGSWQCAAAVLFERESLRGYSAPSRETGERIAGTLECRARTGGYDPGPDGAASNQLVAMCLNGKGGSGRIDGESETFVTHSLRAEGFYASEDGTGRGIPLVPVPILEAGARTGTSTTDPRAGIGIGEPGDPMFTLQRGKQHAVAFSCKDHGADVGDTAPTLRSMGFDKSHANAGGQVAVAFQSSQSGMRVGDQHPTLDSHNGSRRHHGALVNSAVRRLTPEECESLQGFSRGYTKVPYRGNPAADGPRYAAIGNSMAVPCMRWIGQRIQIVLESIA